MSYTPPPLPRLSLNNERVSLEMCSLEHLSGLQKAAADGALWNLWYTPIPTTENMAAEITHRLSLYEQGKSIPFTIFQWIDGVKTIVGMTSFVNIEQHERYARLEIGSTWYAQSTQRTGINTQVKYLMLEYAFEQWGVLAVELRTHRLNTQSRRAIEGLGAQQDGILRAQRIMANGTIRDTVVYSIIASEWPTVKTHLLFKINRPRN